MSTDAEVKQRRIAEALDEHERTGADTVCPSCAGVGACFLCNDTGRVGLALCPSCGTEHQQFRGIFISRYCPDCFTQRRFV